MILDDLVKATKNRVLKEKEQIPLNVIKKEALNMKKGDFSFEKTLKKDGINFICEVKKASPSKGIISEDFPYLEIGKSYEEAGASCISVLTEPDYFKGNKKFLKEISEEVKIPVLRKDFTIDEYMIYDGKIHGASAILLICSILDEHTLKDYIEICDSLGMSALVEAHDENEIKKAIRAGARIIGVNNRDLKTFKINLDNSINLRKIVPKDIIFIAESGITTRSQVELLEKNNVNGVLIGETFMKSDNKKEMLRILRGDTT